MNTHIQETSAALEAAHGELARTQDEEAFKDVRKRLEIYSLLQRGYALVAGEYFRIY